MGNSKSSKKKAQLDKAAAKATETSKESKATKEAESKPKDAKKGSAVERVQKELEKNTKKDEAAPSAGAAAKSDRVQYLKGRNQWVCEKAEKDEKVEIVVEKTKDAVAVYNSTGASIHITGKPASILIDGCKKTSVYVQDVVGTVEVSNCKSVKIFVSGVAPSVSIDKTDGFLIDLSPESMKTSITAANCSEMNAAFEFEGEKVELPLPEQYVTKLVNKDGKMSTTTTVSSLYE